MGLWDLALLGVVTLQVASIAYLPRPRLKALALGGVLVDLADDLVPLRYQLFDTIANLVFHYLSRSIFQHVNCCSFIVSPCDSIFNSVY